MIATVYFPPDGRVEPVLIDVADGSRTEFSIDDPTLNLGCFVWLRDQSRLLCEGWDDVTPDVAAGMFSVDATDGSDGVRLTSNPYGGHDIPQDLSPDGSRIVFLRENPQRDHRPIGIFVSNLDGSDAVRLGGWRSRSICCAVSWAPDGSSILFAAKGTLHTVAPDGSSHTDIAVDDGGGFSFIFDPRWSPDGTRIVFSMYLGDTDRVELYTAAANGTDLVQLTETPRAFEGAADWGQAPPVEG
jgi:Tol biopolymer transport system component